MSDDTPTQKALAWAERTLASIADGSVSEEAVAAAGLIHGALVGNSPIEEEKAEEEKPITFADLNRAEQDALLGAPVSVASEGRATVHGFYAGRDDEGDHYILRPETYGRLAPQYASEDSIIPGDPEAPRALIPGHTYWPDKAPEDARGWIATHVYHGEAIILSAAPDKDGDYYASMLKNGAMRYLAEDALYDWRPLP